MSEVAQLLFARTKTAGVNDPMNTAALAEVDKVRQAYRNSQFQKEIDEKLTHGHLQESAGAAWRGLRDRAAGAGGAMGKQLSDLASQAKDYAGTPAGQQGLMAAGGGLALGALGVGGLMLAKSKHKKD